MRDGKDDPKVWDWSNRKNGAGSSNRGRQERSRLMRGYVDSIPAKLYVQLLDTQWCLGKELDTCARISGRGPSGGRNLGIVSIEEVFTAIRPDEMPK